MLSIEIYDYFDAFLSVINVKIVRERIIDSKQKSIFIIKFNNSSRICVISLIKFIHNYFSLNIPYINNRIFTFLSCGTQLSIRRWDIKALDLMIMPYVLRSVKSTKKALLVGGKIKLNSYCSPKIYYFIFIRGKFYSISLFSTIKTQNIF